MHHFILIKINTDSSKEAKREVEEILTNSIEPGVNTVGWDYVGNIELVTKGVLNSLKLKSYKELEEHYKKFIIKNLEEKKKELEDLLFIGLSKYMPSEEAPLYINRKNAFNKEDSNLRKIIEKKLKSGSSSKLPHTYEELIQVVLRHLLDSLKNNTLLEYYIRKTYTIYQCIEYPEEYSLQCENNHFADLTNKTKGKRTYYLIGDRHF